MSTDDTSGLAASEHKPEPMTEAGCEGKVDRSVSWTAHSAGFAKLRSRVALLELNANLHVSHHESFGTPERTREWKCVEWAYKQVLREIDELSACEECKHAGVMDNDFNGPSS
jgi:hypothetical protein